MDGSRFFKWQRVLGLAGTALAFYLIIFVVLGKTDVSWLLPTDKMARTVLEVWPNLPIFTAESTPINGGKEQEVYYTVPTRLLTRAEIADLENKHHAAVARKAGDPVKAAAPGQVPSSAVNPGPTGPSSSAR